MVASTTLRSVIQRIQQYQIDGADTSFDPATDLPASYGGSSVGIETAENRKSNNRRALMASQKKSTDNRAKLQGKPVDPTKQKELALAAFIRGAIADVPKTQQT
jgi:hypothetical protein